MKLKKLLTMCLADKWLKLLAIALAIVTWVYVSQKISGIDTKTVQLRFTPPPNHYIMAEDWGKVKVTVEGSAAAVRQLPDKLDAHIDVAERKKEAIPANFPDTLRLTIRLASSDIQNLPPGLSVKSFEPSEVNITIDRIVQKRVPVEIDPAEDLDGLVKTGFEIYRIYAVPNQVVIRGPRSVLRGVDSIHPKPIPISGLSNDFTVKNWELETAVKHNGKMLDCLQVENLDQVTIVVIPKKEKAVVKNVRLEVRGLPGLIYLVFTEDNTKPFTTVPEVEIEGPEKALADATVRAFIDLTDILDPQKQPQVRRALQFAVDPGIEVLTKPPFVMVHIKRAPTE